VSLETVDLLGVEILAADVEIHGRGSPSSGDRYSADDLRSIAQANRELAAELRPPAKVGHESGGPAVGYLENLRVSGDKLLADVKDVPRKFAELVRARAFTGRSVELSKITSQRTGRRYPLVVSALAWLGDKLPAVRTLDDVHALYEGEAELVRAYQLDTRAEDGQALVAEALAYGIITKGQADAALRLYASAPDEMQSLLDSMGLAEVRELEAWYLESPSATTEPSVWDEDERSYRAYMSQVLGVRPEDVI
jgi:hypothetical protein